jgi:hypothetical protein
MASNRPQTLHLHVAYGSFASFWPRIDHFRSTPINGHAQGSSACLKGATNGLMRCNKIGAVSKNRLLGVQFIQQRLRLLQVERVEAFGEPAVDRSEHLVGFVAPANIGV